MYQFRGQQRSYNDTVALLLDLVCGAKPDPEAWQTLSAIAHEQRGPRADQFISTTVVARLSRMKVQQQKAALASIVKSIIGSPVREPFLKTLAQNTEQVGQRLVLRLLARWPSPLRSELIQDVKPLLRSGKLSGRSQVAAIAHSLSKISPDDPRTVELLDALLDQRSKTDSLALLRSLEEKTGAHPLVTQRLSGLEEQVRTLCPRCGTELSRAAMSQHLWQQHRLILDGANVREPWAVMEQWLRSERGPASSELLERCQRFALQLDPAEGQEKLQRLLMRTGKANAESRRQLLEEAQEKKASLCPSCYALVPVPQPRVEDPLNLWRGRLSGGQYRLEISHQGLLSSLEILAPRRPPTRGRDPKSTLTVTGAAWVFVGPVLLLALLFAFGTIRITASPLVPVLITLLVALLVFLFVINRWREPIPLQERVVDLAWTWIVPQIHQEGFSLDDSCFLARLALRSVDHGDPAIRAEALRQVIPMIEQKVHDHSDVASHLAALQRLVIDDAWHQGEDPIELVVRELARTLSGELPLAYVESLFYNWETSWWTTGELARVRVLLCDLAFEAGFEVQYLLDLGESYPALGDVLRIGEPEQLVHLRLLWSLRPTRPWDHAGRAETVFEWAENPARARAFEQCDDLLLALEDPEMLVTPLNTTQSREQTEPLQILILSRGVMLQGTLFENRPSALEVNVVPKSSLRGGYELKIGRYRFHFSTDPNNVAIRLERWFRYLFQDFLPQTESVLKWKSPDRAALLRSRGALPCPECHKPMLPRVGRVGQATS